MILKIVSILFFILTVGCIALHYGYAVYLVPVVITSLFILPAVGHKFHGIKGTVTHG